MTPKEFVIKYYPFAKRAETKTGISALFILAQSALETGWGANAPGNMMFGIKDTDGINGNEQLLTTTEISKNANLKFPVIISKTWNAIRGFWVYKVKDYFRKYNTPEDSFIDHCKFFTVNKNYKTALMFRSDPYRFAEEVARAGYATDPDYASKLKSLIDTIKKFA